MVKKNFFLSWFGYSRREQAGTLVLISVIAVIIAVSLLKTKNNVDSNFIGDKSNTSTDSIGIIESDHQTLTRELSVFDPNTASAEELTLLGLSERQANTLINYRNSGAVFKVADDFRKVYGIPLELQDTLIPYINIVFEKPVNKLKPGNKLINMEQPGDSLNNNTAVARVKKSDIYKSRAEFKIDINTADSSELTLLHGIGKVLSVRIIKYRNLLGGYYEAKQLCEVYGIDSILFKQIKEFVVSDTSAIRVSDINTISYADLLRHPYIDKETCSQIFYYIKVNGSILSLDELVVNRIVSLEQLSIIKHYFVCSSDSEEDK